LDVLAVLIGKASELRHGKIHRRKHPHIYQLPVNARDIDRLRVVVSILVK